MKLSREILKALGIFWNRMEDNLQINGIDSHHLYTSPTKLQIFKLVEKIFDPLGFATPVTFFGKIFMQDLCKEGLSWDDPLLQSLCDKWNEVVRKLKLLPTIRICRMCKQL